MQNMYDWLTTWDRYVQGQSTKRPITETEESDRNQNRRKVHVRKSSTNSPSFSEQVPNTEGE